MENRFSVRQLTLTGIFAAAICVLTAVFPIPLGHGYANFGDALVLLSGFLLGPWCGMLASGLGSMLADLFLGYALYAPATLLIKGAMALAASVCIRRADRTKGILRRAAVPGICVLCEGIMIAGYFVFEWIFFGIATAAADLSGNAVQGAVGVVSGFVLYTALSKAPFFAKRSDS